MLPEDMDQSLTNMDAVKPRGPKIFLALFALALVGSAVWYFAFRPEGPIGEAEDPAKIVLVADDDDAGQIVAQLGFTVDRRSAAALAEAGRSAGAPAAGDDIDAILHGADVAGFGYVVFEHPADITFGDRPVSADSANIEPQHRFAVFSVGDLAQPTKVTVDPTPVDYPLPAHAELLRALFEQDRLAATLVGENNLSIEARPLFDKLEDAVELKGAYGLVDQKAQRVAKDYAESLNEPEEADPRPRVLAQPLEETEAIPLINGTALMFVDAPILRTPLEQSVHLDWTGDRRAYAYDLASGQRTRCEALDRWAADRLVVNVRGSAVVRGQGDAALEVYTLAADAAPCGFELRGVVPDDEGVFGRVDDRGHVVRLGRSVDDLVVEVHVPGEQPPSTWPLPGCMHAGGAIWIDETHVAATCSYDPAQLPPTPEQIAGTAPLDAAPPTPEQTWIYILALDSGTILAYRWHDPKLRSSVLWRVGVSPLAILGGGQYATELSLLQAPTSMKAFFAAPPMDADIVRPEFAPPTAAQLRALGADAFARTEIKLDDTAGNVVPSPTGTHLVHTIDGGSRWGQNLAVFELQTQTTTRVAINQWASHGRARFTTDGRQVVFASDFSARDNRVTVAQVASVP